MSSLPSLNNNDPMEGIVTQQNPTQEVRFNNLPIEIIQLIFSFIGTQRDVVMTSRVCKLWHHEASELFFLNAEHIKQEFPQLSVLDEGIWHDHVDLAKFGLDISDTPSQEKCKIKKNLRDLFANLNEKIEDDAGITLLTIPKGLNLNKLISLAEAPKKGNHVNFRKDNLGPISNCIKTVFGDGVTEKTYRLVITNSILKYSKNIPPHATQKYLASFNCEKPRLIDIVALIALTYMRSLTHLYNSNPPTITQCSEIAMNQDVLVGNFPQGILSVYVPIIGIASPGLAGSWKLS